MDTMDLHARMQAAWMFEQSDDAWPMMPESDMAKPPMTRSTSNNSFYFAPAPGLASDSSNRSASSSTVGSPSTDPMMALQHDDAQSQGATMYPSLAYVNPTIVNQDMFAQDSYHQQLSEFGPDSGLGLGGIAKIPGHFVDPNLINPSGYPEPGLFEMPTFHNASPMPSPHQSPAPMYPHYSPPTSPSQQAAWTYTGNYQQMMPGTAFMQPQSYVARRSSLHSYSGVSSHPSPGSDLNEDGEKGRCPFPDCGKSFKDLKAHLLTHQSERPEKCPIVTCEYHTKGFARKYDKNRHTLTHYKGTMVCGFCPNTGSSAEKTFNRADVFKRHLTSVHGVEQTPPNSRKRSPPSTNKKLENYHPDASGKCSTCSACFSNPQDFYEHLDDCVLRIVQQVEPSEEINAQHLTAISQQQDVMDTFERHMIKVEDEPTNFDDDEEDDDEDDEDDQEAPYGRRSGVKSNKPAGRVVLNGAITKVQKPNKKGLTWSQGGVPLAGKGRKKRKDYPPAWGMHADKMRMKKRVTCVYDGQRRLAKDELMLNNEFEVRLPLPGGSGYVTDLDVETLKRAEGFLNATDAEKGAWQYPLEELSGQQHVDLDELMA